MQNLAQQFTPVDPALGMGCGVKMGWSLSRQANHEISFRELFFLGDNLLLYSQAGLELAMQPEVVWGHLLL